MNKVIRRLAGVVLVLYPVGQIINMVAVVFNSGEQASASTVGGLFIRFLTILLGLGMIVAK